MDRWWKKTTIMKNNTKNVESIEQLKQWLRQGNTFLARDEAHALIKYIEELESNICCLENQLEGYRTLPIPTNSDLRRLTNGEQWRE